MCGKNIIFAKKLSMKMFFVLLHLDGEQWFFILFLFDIQRE